MHFAIYSTPRIPSYRIKINSTHLFFFVILIHLIHIYIYIIDMSLRIDQKQFFLNTYRTRKRDTTTDIDQSECEQEVENLFRAFLKKQTSYEMK